MNLQELVHEIAVQARAALASAPRSSPRAQKDAWLLRAAERLEAARERIRAANALDLERGAREGPRGAARAAASSSPTRSGAT